MNRFGTLLPLAALLSLAACSGSNEVTDEDTGSDTSADSGVTTDIFDEVGGECGNGIAEFGESCDGEDLGGGTCNSLGFDDGELGCNANCTYDAALCGAPDLCGNGVVDEGEACDGDPVAATCADSVPETPFGEISCADNCALDTSACSATTTCGDGALEGDEECDDGNTDPNDGCSDACLDEFCGDGVVQDDELCEPGTVAITDCGGVSGVPGVVTCSDACDEQTEECEDPSLCGNGVFDIGEGCDDGDNSETDSCNEDCLSLTCGNGTLESYEFCDGELTAFTCLDQGFDRGLIQCDERCVPDLSGCGLPACGDGVLEDAGEECDDGNLEDGDGCSATCVVELGDAPIVELVPSVVSGETPLEVTFDASSSSDPDGTIESFEWEFGDGASDTGAIVTHTFVSAGVFLVELTVTDDMGNEVVATVEVTVTDPANIAPVSSPSADVLTGEAPLTVNFDGSASSDADGSIVSYEWTFGDGGSDGGTTVTHTYTDVGSYDAELRVTDDDGVASSASLTIVVSDSPNVSPTAGATADVTTGEAPLTVNFDASSSSDADGVIVSYEWDFGDGATDTGAAVSHTYTVAGDYSAVVTVTDDRGDADTIGVPIIVTEPANIVPAADFTLTPPVGCTPFVVSFDASLSNDVDGTIVSYEWDFGDGGTGSGVNPDHSYPTGGTFTVQLTVTDDRGDADTTSMDVQAIEPTAGLAQWVALSPTDPDNWNDASNWCPSALPSTTDTVYIPSGLTHYPNSSTTRTVGGLIVETGARVDVTGALNVTGPVENDGQIFVSSISNWDDTVRNDGTVGGTGEIRVSLDGMSLHGDFPQLTVNTGASVTMDGALSTGRGFFLNGALTLNGHRLIVGGTFTKGGNGDLIMTNGADALLIGGVANFQEFGAPSGDDLSAGFISIQGTQFSASANSYVASGTHEIFFEASVPTRVSAGASGVEFNNVTFDNAAGVDMAQSITIRGTTRVDGGTVTAASSSTRAYLYGDLIDVSGSSFMIGGTVTLKDDVSLPPGINANLEIDSGVSVVLDDSLIVQDDVIVIGSLDLGGQSLVANARFVVNFAGVLLMRTPTDQLTIRGRALFNGNSGPADRHSDGTIFFQGDVWSCVAEGFLGTGTNVVSLQGVASQELTSSSSLCQFQDLDLNNANGIELTGGFTVLGDVLATDGVTSSDSVVEQFTIGGTVLGDGSLLQIARVTFTGNPELPSRLSTGEVIVNDVATLTRDVTLDGDLIINNPQGALFVGPHTLVVRGDFDSGNNGNLFMNDVSSSVTIEGDAFFAGLGDPLGTGDALGPATQLNGGTLTLLGDLETPVVPGGQQRRYFFATGAHLTVFAGTGTQNIFLDGGSQFAGLDLGPGARFVTSPLRTEGNVDVREDTTFTSPVTINGELTVTSGTLINESTLSVSGLAGIANGAQLSNTGTASLRPARLEVFGFLLNAATVQVTTDVQLGSTGTIQNDGTFEYAGTLTDEGGTITGTQPLVDTAP